MKFLKKNWFQTLTVLVCLVLAVVAVRQNEKLARLSLQVDIIRDLQREDQANLRELEEKVSELEARPMSRIKDFEITVTGIDAVRKQLLLNVAVTPVTGVREQFLRVTAHRPESDPAGENLWPSADLSEYRGVWRENWCCLWMRAAQ